MCISRTAPLRSLLFVSLKAYLLLVCLPPNSFQGQLSNYCLYCLNVITLNYRPFKQLTFLGPLTYASCVEPPLGGSHAWWRSLLDMCQVDACIITKIVVRLRGSLGIVVWGSGYWRLKWNIKLEMQSKLAIHRGS